MTLIFRLWSKPLKTAMLLKFSFSCQMHTTVDLFMPAAAEFETVWCSLGFNSEYKPLYARTPWNDATNKQWDHLEIPNLGTNNRVFQSLFVVNFYINLSSIKKLIHIWIYFTQFLA